MIKAYAYEILSNESESDIFLIDRKTIYDHLEPSLEKKLTIKDKILNLLKKVNLFNKLYIRYIDYM